MSKLFFGLMIAALSVEAPNIGALKNVRYQAGVAELATINERVSDGRIVGRIEDQAILASVQYYESRMRPKSSDGDCQRIFVRTIPSPDGGLGKAVFRKACASFGPMQISKGFTSWGKNIDPKWEGFTVKQLRDPETNVRAGYEMHAFWHKRCGGTVADTMASYIAGKCIRANWEGRRRCALAQAFAEKANARLDCGNEKSRLPQTRALVRAVQRAQ